MMLPLLASVDSFRHCSSSFWKCKHFLSDDAPSSERRYDSLCLVNAPDPVAHSIVHLLILQTLPLSIPYPACYHLPVW